MTHFKTVSNLYFLKICFCFKIWGWLYVCVCVSKEDWHWIPLELEWQEIVSHLTWVLVIEPMSSTRAIHTLNPWASSPAPQNQNYQINIVGTPLASMNLTLLKVRAWLWLCWNDPRGRALAGVTWPMGILGGVIAQNSLAGANCWLWLLPRVYSMHSFVLAAWSKGLRMNLTCVISLPNIVSSPCTMG